MALKEYDFPVVCSCGHKEILSGPDEVYELRQLEAMLTIPCCACDYARKTLDSLARGDIDRAQTQGAEWIQFLMNSDDESRVALMGFLEQTLQAAPGVTAL